MNNVSGKLLYKLAHFFEYAGMLWRIFIHAFDRRPGAGNSEKTSVQYLEKTYQIMLRKFERRASSFGLNLYSGLGSISTPALNRLRPNMIQASTRGSVFKISSEETSKFAADQLLGKNLGT